MSKSATPINQPKVQHSWALFDTANSAHALVITAAVFPAYYLNVTDDIIHFGNFSISNSSLYAYTLSFSYLIVAALSPLLSGIADYGKRKMFFMKIFTYLGAISCIGLGFFDGMNTLITGTIFFSLSVIGFAGGLVYYNAYLPLIATEDRFDMLSARGFAYGYSGSVLLLILILWMIMNPEKIGFEDAGVSSRIGFFIVGIWWILIAQIPFHFLPSDEKSKMPRRALKMGYLKIIYVFRQIRQMPNILRFLAAFFAYSMGVQTILLLAATFAESEMNFATSELIILILIIQLVAIAGAYIFAYMSTKLGNKAALLTQLFIWFCICILAFGVRDKISFYTLAGAVGVVLGGIQSLSRSSYSKLIKDNPRSSTSFFSFYDVLEKGGIVFGTFTFGFVAELTGSMRNSTLVLASFFIIGILLMTGVRFGNRSQST
jgi:MFS transporter, UMF1 family